MTMPALSARHAGTGSGTSSGGSVPSDYLDQLASGALEEDGLMSAPSNNLPERDSWTGGLDGGALEGGQAEVDHIVLRPLLTAMGLQMQDASGPQANRVAQDAGLALKAAIEGLRTLHAKKASGRESLAETQLHPVEDNPLYLDGSLDQTMQALFLNRSPVHLNPADAVTESLNHLNQHHEASEIAIEAALSAILRELSPEALAKRFARYKGHAPREGDQGAWNWAMYAHYYKEMRSGRQRGLNRMFAEVYGQVYDREMRARTSGMEG